MDTIAVRQKGHRYDQLKLKRIYEPATTDDGVRVLVDRLWPRGMSKTRADIDYWAKELTPSTELRNLYHEGTLGYEQFSEGYMRYLDSQPSALAWISRLEEWLDEGPVTLLYATTNTQENHAIVLRRWLIKRLAF